MRTSWSSPHTRRSACGTTSHPTGIGRRGTPPACAPRRSPTSAPSSASTSRPIYSGGLGALAGDHLKSCSDLGIPAYGVGLLYHQGYFTQQIDAHGRQIEAYQDLDTSRVPLRWAVGEDGAPVVVEVPIGRLSFRFEPMLADVGRCKLLLLLLDIQGEQRARLIPQALRLYGGDRNVRIGQEVALGVGGYLALRALGVRPGVTTPSGRGSGCPTRSSSGSGGSTRRTRTRSSA